MEASRNLDYLSQQPLRVGVPGSGPPTQAGPRDGALPRVKAAVSSGRDHGDPAWRPPPLRCRWPLTLKPLATRSCGAATLLYASGWRRTPRAILEPFVLLLVGGRVYSADRRGGIQSCQPQAPVWLRAKLPPKPCVEACVFLAWLPSHLFCLHTVSRVKTVWESIWCSLGSSVLPVAPAGRGRGTSAILDATIPYLKVGGCRCQ